MAKQSKSQSSSSAQKHGPARQKKWCSYVIQLKAPCKTVKNTVLKSVTEEINSCVKKAKSSDESTYGIANKILHKLNKA